MHDLEATIRLSQILYEDMIHKRKNPYYKGKMELPSRTWFKGTYYYIVHWWARDFGLGMKQAESRASSSYLSGRN